MKKLTISLVALFGLVTGPLCALSPLPPDVKFQGTGNVVPSGSTMTIGGTFTAASGATINLAAVTTTMGSTTLATGKTATYATGSTLTLSSGSTLTVSGAFAGTPTGGTLNLSALTLTLPTNQVITAGIVTPKVTAISGDGAITIASGTVAITKTSAAALTLAAPSSQNGTRITVVSTTAFAHVITVAGGLWDGTATANTTATFAVVQGASITLVAYGTAWYVESLNAVVPAP